MKPSPIFRASMQPCPAIEQLGKSNIEDGVQRQPLRPTISGRDGSKRITGRLLTALRWAVKAPQSNIIPNLEIRLTKKLVLHVRTR